MAKRQLQNDHDETESKAQYAQRHTLDKDDVEMGEFEDRWEDEFEEEEEVVEGDDLEEDIEEDEDEGLFVLIGKVLTCSDGWRRARF